MQRGLQDRGGLPLTFDYDEDHRVTMLEAHVEGLIEEVAYLARHVKSLEFLLDTRGEAIETAEMNFLEALKKSSNDYNQY